MKIPPKVLICSLLLVAVMVSVFFVLNPYSLENGYTALHQSHFTKAETIFRKLAEHGNAQAQTELGMMYYDGRGPARDIHLAIEWLTKAAQQGRAKAQYQLGNVYYFAKKKTTPVKSLRGVVTIDSFSDRGSGAIQSDAKAEQWYQQAAQQGHIAAQYHLAQVYEHSNQGLKDLKKAVKWYQTAAKNGSLQAITQLGIMYHDGYGISTRPNYEQARKRYQQAADQGYANAQVRLGGMYFYGEGVEKNYATAKLWFTKAALQNDASAQYDLGILNERQHNYQDARKWHQRAADNGSIEAQNRLLLYQTRIIPSENQ